MAENHQQDMNTAVRNLPTSAITGASAHCSRYSDHANLVATLPFRVKWQNQRIRSQLLSFSDKHQLRCMNRQRRGAVITSPSCAT